MHLTPITQSTARKFWGGELPGSMTAGVLWYTCATDDDDVVAQLLADYRPLAWARCDHKRGQHRVLVAVRQAVVFDSEVPF